MTGRNGQYIQNFSLCTCLKKPLGEQDSNVKTDSKGNMCDYFDWIYQAKCFYAVLST